MKRINRISKHYTQCLKAGMQKSAIIAILSIVICFSITACSTKANIVFPDRIYHAGGITNEMESETNSLEALNYSYNKGIRFVELDFIWTEDKKLVCNHDWDARYSKNLTGYDVPSYDVFMTYHNTAYGYTSPALDELADWLSEHPDMTIITDIKSDNCEGLKLICNTYPEISKHIIPQIYSFEEYEEIESLEFKNIFLTLYKLSPEERSDIYSISQFLDNSPKIKAIVTAASEENFDLIKKLCTLDVPCFVHTINTEKEEQQWHKIGVYGIYTDFLGIQ